ncbi:MAG: hypothetical protein ABIG64_09150 [Candidatus Omnitrophota bacterium]
MKYYTYFLIIVFSSFFSIFFIINKAIHAQQFPLTEEENLIVKDEDSPINLDLEDNSIFEETIAQSKETEQNYWNIIPEVAGTKSILEDSKIEEFKKKDKRFLTIWQLRTRYNRY